MWWPRVFRTHVCRGSSVRSRGDCAPTKNLCFKSPHKRPQRSPLREPCPQKDCQVTATYLESANVTT